MRHHSTTIFTEISAIAARCDAVNLGQGFPDTDGPQPMLAAARRAIADGANQYPPLGGRPELVSAIAEHQRHWYGIGLDAEQILVTMGATEAISAALLAFLEPGDEVVMFEPYYDAYAALVDLAGGVRRTSVLRFPDFRVDEESLRAAFSDRTRLVLLNTPHNPTGKVFTRAELDLIASLAQIHDAWVVTDEVYEHLVYDDARHIPIATLPGMAERTLTISSAGKTFSATGWKVGWVSGPAQAVAAIRTVKQFLTFAGGGPFQLGVAAALGMGDEAVTGLRDELRAKRDFLAVALRGAGFTLSNPDGTYYIVADAAPLGVTDATAFARELPGRIGVAAIPVQVFHDDPTAAPTLVRFAFCKRPEVLEAAATRLARLAP